MPNAHPEQPPVIVQGPKTKLYDHLNINWKFGLHNYSLVEKPTSPTQPAAYRFGISGNEKRDTFHNLVFGATQGLSKNIYKIYSVGLVFNGMTHQEALDYCAKHSSLRELGRILEDTHESHGLWSIGSSGEKVIKGGLLESILEDLENRFSDIMFGVCSGLMESFYLIVVSKHSINKSNFGDVLREMEKDVAKSDVTSFCCCPTDRTDGS
jgi:hypothetical protein